MSLYPLIYFSVLRNGSAIVSWFVPDTDNVIPFSCTYTINVSNVESKSIESVWYDFYTHKFYHCVCTLNNIMSALNEEAYIDITYTLGGIVNLWLITEKKSIRIKPCRCSEIENASLFSTLQNEWEISRKNLQENFDRTLTAEIRERIELMKSYVETIMGQYKYRYVIHIDSLDDVVQSKNSILIDSTSQNVYIEESLMDGSHDKLHDRELMIYHQAGIPQKLAVKIADGKSELTVYYWFEELLMRIIFKDMYDNNKLTEVDFIIRIDKDNFYSELSLYRKDMDIIYVIPKEAFQLILFRDGFEEYRSENYNQERGAWIW